MPTPDRPPGVPPPQRNLQEAVEESLRQLAGGAADQFLALGATPAGDLWQLRVLDDVLDVDVSSGAVRTSAGKDVGHAWQILALHYLATRRLRARGRPEVTFADLPGGRVYAVNYNARVIRRLCATAGRDAETLSAAAEALGGRRAEGADLAFDFDVFPLITLRLLWYAADEEFAATATILLPRDIERMLPIEDVVVASEQLVARLSGKPF